MVQRPQDSDTMMLIFDRRGSKCEHLFAKHKKTKTETNEKSARLGKTWVGEVERKKKKKAKSVETDASKCKKADGAVWLPALVT